MTAAAVLIGILALILIVIMALGLVLAFAVWVIKRTFTTQHDEDHELGETPL